MKTKKGEKLTLYYLNFQQSHQTVHKHQPVLSKEIKNSIHFQLTTPHIQLHDEFVCTRK